MFTGDTRAAIAELKRRNRGAGKRLSPLVPRPTHSAEPVPGGDAFSPQGRTGPRRPLSSSGSGNAQTARAPVSNAQSKHPARPGRSPLFSSSAPMPGARAERGGGERHAGETAGGRRVPRKPTGASRPAATDAGRRANNVYEKKDTEPPNAKASNEAQGKRISFTPTQQKKCTGEQTRSGRTDTPEVKPRVDNVAAELESLNGYYESQSWDKHVSLKVLDVLDGEKMEEPYTTDLWRQPVDVEKPRVGGYYACIRCRVPIVAPEHQITYTVRGIAAFQCLNKRAAEVRIAGLGGKKLPGAEVCCERISRPPLTLHVMCRCCGGFLGILSPEAPSAVNGTFLFVVNSCCLRYVANRITKCRLDAQYDADDDAESDTTALGDGEIDFDDFDIFEM